MESTELAGMLDQACAVDAAPSQIEEARRPYAVVFTLAPHLADGGLGGLQVNKHLLGDLFRLAIFQ